MKYLVIIIAAVLCSGCAHTSVVMLEGGAGYAPTTEVDVLTEMPSRPYKKIAMLEARAPAGTPITDLLESMRKKAASIGADAVIPTENASKRQPQSVMYNPWLGAYQTVGGGTLPIIRGFAIKYTD